jgi:hypothetical protein
MGAVPNMAVFCSFLILLYPIVLRRYCPSDFETVSIIIIIIIINLFYMRYLQLHTRNKPCY